MPTLFDADHTPEKSADTPPFAKSKIFYQQTNLSLLITFIKEKFASKEIIITFASVIKSKIK